MMVTCPNGCDEHKGTHSEDEACPQSCIKGCLWKHHDARGGGDGGRFQYAIVIFSTKFDSYSLMKIDLHWRGFTIVYPMAPS